MKMYIKPQLEVINLRIEEKISSGGSITNCITRMVGSCYDDDGNLIMTDN